MKIDIKHLRWVFLGLYIAIVLGLLAIAYTEEHELPEWLWLLPEQFGWAIVVVLATVISQALFVFCSGTINLCRPIRKRRLFLPVVLGAFMLTVLAASLFCSLTELFDLGRYSSTVWTFWILVGINWIGWSVAFFVTYRKQDRYALARKLVLILLCGSLLELLVAIPSHIIVRRRPGCFVGLLTGLGLTGGITVMLWAFGPGIILLFLRERRNRELRNRAQQANSIDSEIAAPGGTPPPSE
jgi:NAD/NADP transhydrogenase beta subunit